jgi:hypothetical protein
MANMAIFFPVQPIDLSWLTPQISRIGLFFQESITYDFYPAVVPLQIGQSAYQHDFQG